MAKGRYECSALREAEALVYRQCVVWRSGVTAAWCCTTLDVLYSTLRGRAARHMPRSEDLLDLIKLISTRAFNFPCSLRPDPDSRGLLGKI